MNSVWLALFTIFVGTLRLALIAEFSGFGLLLTRFVIYRGPMPAIAAEMPGVLAFSTSISPRHFNHLLPSKVSCKRKESHSKIVCAD